MKTGLKRVLFALGIMTVAALVVLLLIAGKKSEATRTCAGLRVEFADDRALIGEDEIKALLDRSYGAYVGVRPDSLRLYRIERMLNAQSAIQRAEAYVTPDNMLNVLVYRRQPVLKCVTPAGEFYCDASGFVFPVQGNFQGTVPVMYGNAPISDGEWMKRVMELTRGLGKLLSPVERIDAAADGALALKLADGKERILLGKPRSLKVKLDRTNKYLRDIRPSVGTDYYSTVNVEYRGQIICRK